ncbi:hypothetical protein [Pseudomonas asplenii]|uniref:hypothetical protein n=1 Tax=Pseudomonas asplenii TaxID=53407 RepID=UPI0006B4ADD4|nr:hypothetical protein [Pseudomonas fuscovaginae]KPA95095.1 hypothetical protein PF70_04923 [Pseudomonas fuscovaginae]
MSVNINPQNLKKLDQPVVLSANPGGVGTVDTQDPAKPLPVLAGPLDLEPGDRIDLYWKDAARPVSTYEHPMDEPPISDFVTLAVDIRDIQSGREPVPVWFRFTPFPGGTWQDSDITLIRVKLEIPGGVDIDPATPYENEALQAPQIQPAGVITSPHGVSVIVAPYLNMSVGDRVSVAWDERKIDYPPLAEEHLNRNLLIAIPAQIVEAVGSSPSLPVRYEIHDVVGNWSKHSPATRVVVDLEA